MKRIITIAALVLITISSFAQSGKSIYQKYSDEEGISAVYISPAMFRMIGKIPDVKNAEGENVNLSPIIQSLSGLYLISSENKKINVNLKADAEKFLSSGKYELFMEAKDSGETVRMYTVGTETIVESFVMIAADGDETTFICLDGKMKREDVDNLLAEKMK